MSSYQVNADALFSDESGSEGSPPALHPSPKRLRPAPAQASFPSFNASRPSPGPRAPSFPSFKPSVPFKPPAPNNPPNGNRPGPRFPSFNASGGPPPRRGPPPPPRQPTMRQTNLGPLGRGRGATLPAHVTGMRERPQSMVADPAQSAPRPGAHPDHVSIIPEHLRERFLAEEARKKAAAAPAERKRPAARRRRDSTGDPARRAQLAQNGRMSGKKSASSSFGLASLLDAAKRNSPQSLIRLDPDRAGTKKVKRSDADSVYKAVSMTKEAREREERDRRREAERREEEVRELAVHYARMREMERRELAVQAARWAREPTVAAGMRDAHEMAKAEKYLFHREEDKAMMDNLGPLGLKLHPVEEDEETTRLLTIEVIHI